MTNPRNASLLALLTLGCLAGTVPVLAQTTVTVGTADPFAANNIPFGTAGQYSQGGSAEYEQLYSGSVFSGPVSINTISFSSGQFTGNTAEAVNYNLTVYLSNTTATSATLNSSFSKNYGTNRTRVFSGTLPAALLVNNTFDLNIPVLANSFVFNPGSAAGSNLLFDVFINADNGSNSLEFFQGTSSTQTESVFFSDYPADTNPQVSPGGLLTRFTVSAAPEPSSFVALALGLGAAGALVARKRRQGTAA